MDDIAKLEKDIIAMFQEKGDAAHTDIELYLDMIASSGKRKLIKKIVQRLELDSDGNYYLRVARSKGK